MRHHRISEEELVEMTRLADSLAEHHKTYREVALIVAKRLRDERDALDAELSGLLDGLIGTSAHDPGMDDALRVAHANLTELIWCRDQLGELLATIHRDGGHHTARVGLAASARDAQDRVIRERAALDETLAERKTEQPERWRSPIVQRAHDEADHDYREVLYDRDDRPIRPTCAYCGRSRAYCKGRKP